MLHFSRLKINLILGLCLLGLLFAMPNLLDEDQAADLPDWLPHKQISLGLDLQGGSHLLLEVGVETVVRERLNSLVDETRAALRSARIGYSGLGTSGERVIVTLREPETDLESARDLLRAIDRNLLVSAADDGAIELTLSEAAMRETK